jgi:hypothetical protein
MIKGLISWTVFILGAISIASSWFSIGPASAKRHQELWERYDSDRSKVTDYELIMIKDDHGMSAIAMIIFGTIGFTVVTIIGLAVSSVRNKKRPVPLCVGTGWLLLGIYLHALAWSG